VAKGDVLLSWKREESFEGVTAVNGETGRDERRRQMQTVIGLRRAMRKDEKRTFVVRSTGDQKEPDRQREESAGKE